jgi:hypothetical protein
MFFTPGTMAIYYAKWSLTPLAQRGESGVTTTLPHLGRSEVGGIAELTKERGSPGVDEDELVDYSEILLDIRLSVALDIIRAWSKRSLTPLAQLEESRVNTALPHA